MKKACKIELSIVAILAGVFFVMPVHAAPINWSLNSGASINASSSWDSPGSVPENAIDGDVGTMWLAPTWGFPGSPQWLELDLGGEYVTNEIVLITRPPLGYEGYYIDYNLYKSNSSGTWNLLGSGSLIESWNPNDYTDVIDVGTAVGKVRFEVVGGTHWAHLYELQVWGDDAVSSVPEPSTMLLLGSGLLGLVGLRRRRKA